MRLREVAASRVRFGYRRLTVLLRREGWCVNAKRIYRLYTEEGLTVRTKHRTKAAGRARVPQPGATAPNQRWSMDFMSERVADGRWFRMLTVVEQFTRECVCLVADQSLTGEKVAQALEPVVMQRGAPRAITVDNGSEFASRVMDACAYRHGIQLDFTRPAYRSRTASSRASIDGYGMNASMWKCFSRSRMCDRCWRGGSRTTIGFDPIVRWQTGRLRRLWPSGSRRPHRLTRTPLNYWRHSREL